jgi:hypothetical protein
VVVRAVRVVHGGHELGVTAVHTPAVVEQASVDCSLVEEASELIVDTGSFPRRSAR